MQVPTKVPSDITHARLGRLERNQGLDTTNERISGRRRTFPNVRQRSG
ncbi:unnamed protein product [Ectocarpus sp. CCAP 1310/34]|nr:unnamed protein product [Ectocarpus sp. CCAP 1310/34]